MVALKDLQPGQNLRIKTEKEVILGKFKKLSVDGARVEVSQPIKCDGTPLGRMICIYTNEIVNWVADVAEQSDDSDQMLFSPAITTSQHKRILKMIDATVYINQADRIYHEAMTEIAENFDIGIHTENVEMGR